MNHLIVQGLGFGDEGKGSIVEALVRRHRAKLVVKFTGGSQCAHHVVADLHGKRVNFCHAQTGAGTLAGAATYLGPHVKVDPISLRREIEALRALGVFPVVMVDVRAPVITPWHKAVNRLRELARGAAAAHGSCGMGIGELGADLAEGRTVLRWGDLGAFRKQTIETVWLFKRLQAQQIMATMPATEAAAQLLGILDVTSHAWWEDVCKVMNYAWASTNLAAAVETTRSDDTIIYEGAQGFWLDETHGFQPHTTWSDCTFRHAEALAAEIGGHVTKLGVLRCFATRHGAGPLPTEDPDPPEMWRLGEHNGAGPWQGAFRYGFFDAVLARQAIQLIGGIDALALTCVDRWDEQPFVYRDSDALARATEPVSGVEQALQRPVDLISAGPMAVDKTFRAIVTEMV